MTGAPVQRASVLLLGKGGWSEMGPSADVDPDGRYTLHAPPGTWRVFVGASSPDDFYHVERDLNDQTPESTAPTVILVAGATVTLDVTMQPAGKVKGVVLMADGAPAVDAVVFVYAVPGNLASYGYGAHTDTAGRFTSYVPYAVPTDAVAEAFLPPATSPEAKGRSVTFTVGPEQTVTGIRVVLPASSIPSPTSSGGSGNGEGGNGEGGGGGGLPATGSPSAAIAVAGACLVLVGASIVAVTRRRIR